MTPAVPALPKGAVLLHIGPYKTGSTALQQALFDEREVLAAHGVHYPDKWRRLLHEGHALMRWAPRGTLVPRASLWDDFAAGIRARPERVCISTEDFGRLRKPGRVHQVVTDLGPDRVHVLAVARAFHRVLPSHWQERVKSGRTLAYDAWLRALFCGDDSLPAHRSFWSSHDIGQMAERWLDLLPPDRFIVVVSDDTDRLLLSRVFEQLLELPEGLLAPRGSANQSLSANAAEVLRRVNVAFDERGWSDRDFRKLVRKGVVRGLQEAGRAGADVPMPPLPTWVRPMVLERSRARIDAIGALGLRVVGDLDRLLPPEAPADLAADAPDEISVRAAAAGVVAAFEAGLVRESEEDLKATPAEPPTAGQVLAAATGRTLVGELARRGRRRLRHPR